MMAIQSTAQRVRAPQEELWVEVDDSVDKALVEIAATLTSANRFETLTGTFLSHLARILGGGQRTVW